MNPPDQQDDPQPATDEEVNAAFDQLLERQVEADTPDSVFEGDGKTLVDYQDGVAQYLSFDDVRGEATLHTIADVEPNIEVNKALYNEDDGGWSPTKEWRRTASFPIAMIPYLTKLYGANPFATGNDDLLTRVLNDPDLRYFRTAPGRI